MHWVKVRGHSKNVGNDAADKAATWGQNGGSKNVENLQECMEWLLASTQTQMTDDADADVDDDADEDAGSADAVNDAGTDDTEYRTTTLNTDMGDDTDTAYIQYTVTSTPNE